MYSFQRRSVSLWGQVHVEVMEVLNSRRLSKRTALGETPPNGQTWLLRARLPDGNGIWWVYTDRDRELRMSVSIHVPLKCPNTSCALSVHWALMD